MSSTHVKLILRSTTILLPLAAQVQECSTGVFDSAMTSIALCNVSLISSLMHYYFSSSEAHPALTSKVLQQSGRFNKKTIGKKYCACSCPTQHWHCLYHSYTNRKHWPNQTNLQIHCPTVMWLKVINETKHCKSSPTPNHASFVVGRKPHSNEIILARIFLEQGQLNLPGISNKGK